MSESVNIKRLLGIMLLILIPAVVMFFAVQQKTHRASLLMPEIYAPALGSVAINPQGQIILVSFFDYTSPDTHEIFPALFRLVHANKNIRFIYRVLPLSGPHSTWIAKLSIAAQFQGKQLEFRKALLLSKERLTQAQVLKLAKAAGLDTDKLVKDADLQPVVAQLQENYDLAYKLGIRSVPTYVLAFATEHNDIVTANLIEGKVGIEQLVLFMEDLKAEMRETGVHRGIFK